MLLVFGTMRSLRQRGNGLEESKHLAVHWLLGSSHYSRDLLDSKQVLASGVTSETHAVWVF